ncbi:hypothetical protein HLVA_01410 [Haliovirga abyssi]|uniref:General secretion pathway protein GspG n=2 Tax=Haliovirga abyssi TaxID=2996794 RepID=A0AAU9DIG6_9FUSO|nr:hypothetical protein HLVA_01410 [Haliovirga abyssi]
MIVIAIIAILSVVALPELSSNIKKAKDSNVLKVVGTLRDGINIYKTDNEQGDNPESIQKIKYYILGQIKNSIEDKDIDITDGITSLEILAGTVNKDGIISKGSKGKLNGLNNIAEIYYNNGTGTIYVDGANGISGFKDTKNKNWNSY